MSVSDPERAAFVQAIASYRKALRHLSIAMAFGILSAFLFGFTLRGLLAGVLP